MNTLLLRRIFLAAVMSSLAIYPISARAINVNANTNLQLYAISFYDNQLIAVNTTNGQGMVTALLSTNVSAYGIATRSNVIYTFSPNSNAIIALSATNGSVSTNNRAQFNGLKGEGDLAFRSDGVGFLTSALNSDNTIANALYTFTFSSTNGNVNNNNNNSTNTNSATQWIGTTALPLNALAFDSNDVLYALAKDGTNLYTVDQTDGALTVVGPLGVAAASPFAGMTFGPDGTLYAAINDRLYTINKTSGAATVVSTNVLDFGFTSISGLAFAPRTEPAAFFSGQAALGNGTDYLAFTNGTVFGYYSLTNYPYIVHQDLGLEYFVDANDGTGAAYFYDFTSGAWFYTSPTLFPYIYDFKLNAWLYYFPDTNRPGHYTTKPRFFYDFGTSQVVTNL